jgi:hypothetical protein
VELDIDTTWRLCARSITPEQAAERARIEGDGFLAGAALQIVAITCPVGPSAIAAQSS